MDRHARAGRSCAVRIVFGSTTGSIEMADQCKVLDLTDDFDFDAPESGEALLAMPSQIVVGYDEVMIAVRIAMDEHDVPPEIKGHVLTSLGQIFGEVIATP